MFKNKILIFMMLVIALLSIGVASAEESSNLDDSSVEVITSVYDEDTSIDTVSKDNLQIEDDVKTFSNENTSETFTQLEDEIDKDDKSHLGEVNIATVSLNNDVYVSLNGSDNNAGASWSGAVQSISKAMDIVLDNGTIYLADGTYTTDSQIEINKTVAIVGNGSKTVITSKGDGVFYISADNVVICNTTFTDNYACDFGGVIANAGFNCSVISCTFVNNYAIYGGAAIYNDFDSSNFIVNNCTFINNMVVYSGGAIFNAGSNCSVIGCTFVNNSAGYGGGAISNEFYDFSVSNSVFINNTAQNGTTIYSSESSKANDNWWGNNTPNLEELFVGDCDVTYDTYVVLNLTVSNNVVYLNFYRNGTAEVINVPVRDVDLTIGNTNISGKIVNGTFNTTYVTPKSDTYEIKANVDNQELTVTLTNNNVYVNPEGNDANNGTSWDSPFKTIQHAMEVVSYNGTIYLSDGTHEVASQITIDRTVTIVGNGSKTFITNNKTDDGVFKVTADNVAIYNSTFVNNSANIGGVIYNEGNGLLVSGCSFVNNSASKGVIYNGATLTLNNNTYSGISEGKTYIYNNATLFCVNITVLNNETVKVHSGETIKLNATVTCDGASVAGGTLKFIIDGTECSGEVISNLDGNYTCEYSVTSFDGFKVVGASYSANNASVSTGILTCKSISELAIEINNITYGEDLIISGNITKGVDGNVTIIINDDVKYNTTIASDGKIYQVIPDLGAGDYKITVKYDGDDEYMASEFNKTINVAQTKVNLEVNIANVTYGEVSAITVKLTGVNNTKLNGTVVITINGGKYSVYIVNGTGTSDKVKLPADTYNFVATGNSSNNNYTNTVVNGTFNVVKASLNMEIKADSIDVGQNVTVIVSALANATGNVTIKVDNKTYDVEIKNGVATKEIANLTAGNYTINITYTGDDNYNSTLASANFTVSKLATNIDFEAENITYGENATLTIINLPEDATGNLTIIIDDGEVIVDKMSISNFEAGNHTITIKYSGNDKYLESNATHNISVAKADSKLNVYIKNTDYGEILNITAALFGVNNDQLNGSITLTINNNNYTIEIKDGICTYDDIKLPAGMYEFNATWGGNTNYNNAAFDGEFNINKIDPTIKVDVANVKVGENLTVKVILSEDATGNVTITIGKDSYIVNLKDGTVAKNITITKADNYTVDVVYNGDNNYNTVKDSANFTASKISNYNITVNAENITLGQNATIKVILPNDINEEITIAVDNENYTVIAKDGIAIVTVDGLSAGEYKVVVNFENDKYMENEVNKTFNVSKIKDYSINITSEAESKNTKVTVNLPKDANGNVSILINPNNYSGIVKNGTANIIIPGLSAGEYNATISYGGDDKYFPNKVNTTIKVINQNVNLTVNDVVMIYHDGSRLYASLLDFDGNPIANATLYFTINGQTYTRTTDANGSASIALNLEAGTYNAVITYNTTGVNASVTIKSSITANDIVKMYQNDTQFYAKFTGTDGNPLASKTVTFNINGVFYTRNTDENGIAKLSINLNPGSYTLTVINPENNEQQGFNVLVKSLIKTNDLTKYYLNASKFEGKIYNKDGSLAINKEVSFNINGVFYKRTTDVNGVVSLSINLNPGSYTITTIYDGLSIGNKVNILHTLETNDLTMSYGDGSKFSVKTLDGQGRPLANQNITYNVNGVFYHKTTGSDGVANLNINLMSGEYIITSIWNDFQIGNTIKII